MTNHDVDALRPTISLIPLDKFVVACNLFERDVTVLIRRHLNWWKENNKFKLKENEKHLFLYDESVISCNLSAVSVQMTYKSLRVTRNFAEWQILEALFSRLIGWWSSVVKVFINDGYFMTRCARSFVLIRKLKLSLRHLSSNLWQNYD